MQCFFVMLLELIGFSHTCYAGIWGISQLNMWEANKAGGLRRSLKQLWHGYSMSTWDTLLCVIRYKLHGHIINKRIMNNICEQSMWLFEAFWFEGALSGPVLNHKPVVCVSTAKELALGHKNGSKVTPTFSPLTLSLSLLLKEKTLLLVFFPSPILVSSITIYIS